MFTLRPDSFTIQSSWEHPFYPIYFFPTSTLDPSSLRESPDNKPERGVKTYDLVVGDRKAPAAVSEFTGQASDTKDLAGLLKIEFSAADAWLEEDERIYVHPKDPYKVNLIQKHAYQGWGGSTQMAMADSKSLSVWMCFSRRVKCASGCMASNSHLRTALVFSLRRGSV